MYHANKSALKVFIFEILYVGSFLWHYWWVIQKWDFAPNGGLGQEGNLTSGQRALHSAYQSEKACALTAANLV